MDSNQNFRNDFVVLHYHISIISSQIIECIIFAPYELSITIYSMVWRPKSPVLCFFPIINVIHLARYHRQPPEAFYLPIPVTPMSWLNRVSFATKVTPSDLALVESCIIRYQSHSSDLVESCIIRYQSHSKWLGWIVYHLLPVTPSDSELVESCIIRYQSHSSDLVESCIIRYQSHSSDLVE